jgi:hypothetical protein
MNLHFLKKIAFVCVIITASVYAPLRAMEDSTAAAQKKEYFGFSIWHFVYKSIPTRVETEFGQKLSQDLKGNVSVPVYPDFTISIANYMWSNDKWVTNFFYNYGTRTATSRDASVGCTTHEAGAGIGYIVVNTPRFRLYPMLSTNYVFDIVNITPQTSLTSLLSTRDSPNISMERFGGFYELAVGADYRFPIFYGDIYIMAKVGYNLVLPGLFNSAWKHGSQILTDASPEWFSRRGVFFQIGIGFGTERQ